MPYQLAPNNVIIERNTAFTGSDGVNYSASWWEGKNESERNAVGITWVNGQPSYDQKFYWGTGKPKDLVDLKTVWVDRQKETAKAFLSSCDWLVLRESEGGTACPSEWKTYRANVRTVSDQREAKINACSDVDELCATIRGHLAETVAGTSSNGATEKKKEDGSSYSPKQWDDIPNPDILPTWPTKPS